MKPIKIYKAGLHLGEENIVEGNQNSGMINFSGCHLSCHFCYTPETSKEWQGRDYTQEEFVSLCEDLVRRGARNLNLISPTQFFASLHAPLTEVKARFSSLLPVVLKISGYESLPVLNAMTEVTDVFVPDFKVWDDGLAKQVGLPQRYGSIARTAIERMMETHGETLHSPAGKISRGILIRHLMMPGATEDSFAIVDQLGRIGYQGALNFMTYFYDPKSKRVSNASPADVSLLAGHALSFGIHVLVNGKVNHPYRLHCHTSLFGSNQMVGGAHVG